jgi:hypothetical protein
MGWDCGVMSARCLHQLAEMQRGKGALHCAFGQASFIGQHAQAGFDRLPALASSAPGKKKINQECGRLLIVSDNIAHEHIQNVIIDRHGLMEARHARIVDAVPINGQHFSHRNDP